MPTSWIEWHTYDSEGNISNRTRYDVGNRILGKGTLIDLFLLQEGWKRYGEYMNRVKKAREGKI